MHLKILLDRIDLLVNRLGQEFPRLRMGVGRPENMELISYVLSKIPKEKMEMLEEKFEKASKIIEKFIEKKTIEGIDITRL